MLPACMGIGRSYAGIAIINRPFLKLFESIEFVEC